MIDDFRYEVKFHLNEKKYSFVQNWLYVKTPFVRSFPNRTVNSLYFDDVNYSSVKDNLSGVAQRSKYRLRWYDSVLTNPDHVIFEEKMRNGRVGKKKHIRLPDVGRDLSHANIHHTTQAINRSISNSKYQFTFDYLFPTLLLSYDREYFADNNSIRITVDKNLQFGAPIAEKTISQHQKIRATSGVLEVKFNASSKDWAHSYISQLNLTPVRNSKYLAGLALLKIANYL